MTEVRRIVNRPHMRAKVYVQAKRAVRWLIAHGYKECDASCPAWVLDAIAELGRYKREQRARRDREQRQQKAIA